MNRAMWRELAQDPGFDITVAAPRFFKGDLRPLTIDPEPPESPLKLVALDASGTGWIHGFRYNKAQLHALMRESNFDVVHAWEEPYIYAGYQIARALRGLPSRFVFRTAQNLLKRYPPPFRYFEHATLKRAQGWISGGSLGFETMLKRGYPTDRGRILPLAVDLKAFRPIEDGKRKEVLKEIGLQPPVLGFLGRLSKDKGLALIMQALELLPASQPWNLLLLGSGPYKSNIEAWARARGWQDRVRVKLVKHDDVPRHLAAMDVLLAPSQTTRHWREQFGRMIVEAFACGVPVIGSDSGEIPFVIGDAGRVVSERDPAAWACAICEVLSSPESRVQFAQRGLQRSRTYSCSAVAVQFSEFYRWVAEQPLTAPTQHSSPERASRPRSSTTNNEMPGRLRIVFAVESGTDVRLVEGLAERFELEVIARKIEGGVEVSQKPSRTVATTIGPASRLKFAYSLMKYLAARKDSVDAVIVQGYGVAALAVNLSARRAGLPAYMLVCSPLEAYYKCRKRDFDPAKPYKWHEAAVLRWLARLNAICGQQYLVLSQHLAETVRGHGTHRPIHIVPVYGVDTGVFRFPDRPKREIKACRSLPTQQSLLFFSSRIAPEKDADTLLAAMRLLVDRGRDLTILHRSGGFRIFLEHAKRFGVDNHVIATDAVHPLTELPLDYQACDLCVQASREEGLGFSVLEALACGTPVVAAGVGGLRETIIDGRTGWTYPPGDAAALAHCIEDVLDHPGEASRRALLGRELVVAAFERSLVFDQMTEIMTAKSLEP